MYFIQFHACLVFKMHKIFDLRNKICDLNFFLAMVWSLITMAPVNMVIWNAWWKEHMLVCIFPFFLRVDTDSNERWFLFGLNFYKFHILVFFCICIPLNSFMLKDVVKNLFKICSLYIIICNDIIELMKIYVFNNTNITCDRFI